MNKKNVAIDVAAIIGAVVVGTAINSKITDVKSANDDRICSDADLPAKKKVTARAINTFCTGVTIGVTTTIVDKAFKKLADKCKR